LRQNLDLEKGGFCREGMRFSAEQIVSILKQAELADFLPVE